MGQNRKALPETIRVRIVPPSWWVCYGGGDGGHGPARSLEISVLDILEDDEEEEEDVPSLENLKRRIAELVPVPNPRLWVVGAAAPAAAAPAAAADRQDEVVVGTTSSSQHQKMIRRLIESNEQLRQELETDDDNKDDDDTTNTTTTVPVFFLFLEEDDADPSLFRPQQVRPQEEEPAVEGDIHRPVEIHTATTMTRTRILWIAGVAAAVWLAFYLGVVVTHPTLRGSRRWSYGTMMIPATTEHQPTAAQSTQSFGSSNQTSKGYNNNNNTQEVVEEEDVSLSPKMESCEILPRGPAEHPLDDDTTTTAEIGQTSTTLLQDTPTVSSSSSSSSSSPTKNNNRGNIIRLKPRDAVVKGRFAQVRTYPQPVILFYHKSNRAIWKLDDSVGALLQPDGRYQIEARVARKGPAPTWLYVGLVVVPDDDDDAFLWEQTADQYRTVLTPARIPATGGWNQFERMKLGRVSVPTTRPSSPSSSLALVVAARGEHKDVGVDFQQLVLTRMGDHDDAHDEYDF